MSYDSQIPAERQDRDWECSARTATFMAESIGLPVNAALMRDQMTRDGLVTPALGLLDGSGSQLAAWLTQQFGVKAGHFYPAEWETVCDMAGEMPLGLGSSSLYHWVAVRAVNDDGALALANPAPGWRGLGDTMTEGQFQQWAPWACIYIAVEDDLSAEERDELEQLRARVPELEAELGAERGWGTSILSQEAAHAATLAAADAAQDWRPVRAVAERLRKNAAGEA